MTALQIETPAAVVDLDRLERNLVRWQEHCDRVGLVNRPHIKTHRSIAIARRQLELGAGGITCQKLGEAEVMADGGCTDILVSFNILGESKLARLRALLDRVDLTSAPTTPCSSGALVRRRRRSAAAARARRLRHGARPDRRQDARGRCRARRGDRRGGRARLRRALHLPGAAGRRRFPLRGRPPHPRARARGRGRLGGRDAGDVGEREAAAPRDRVPRRHVRVPRPRDCGGGSRDARRRRADGARDRRQPARAGPGDTRLRQQGAHLRSRAGRRALRRDPRGARARGS